MKNLRTWIAVVLCGALCALTACSSGTSFVKPGYDFRSVGRVATVVTMNVGNPAQQQEIADLFAMEVLKKGYDVIDRANLADLAREAQFQNASGMTSPEGRAKLALHNVSALIVVNVDAPYAYQVPPGTRSYWVHGYWAGPGYWVPGHYEVREVPGYVRESGEDISITAKMLDVQTGTLLWAGEGTGSLKSGLMTIGGALVGAGAGALLGSAVGNTRGAIIGGVAGGLAGGVAGTALQPDMAQLMRSVIEKTCRGLPERPMSQLTTPRSVAAVEPVAPQAASAPTIAPAAPAPTPAAPPATASPAPAAAPVAPPAAASPAPAATQATATAGPRILFTTTPTILVLVDGAPVLKQMADLDVERVVNTRSLIVKTGSRFYLTALTSWYEAAAIEGPWAPSTNPPAVLEKAKEAAVAAKMVDLMQPQPGAVPLQTPPAVRVSTVPTELIETDGPPQLFPVENTRLLQVKNTDDVIFLDLNTSRYYVRLSNHWFTSKTLYGPWAAVAAGNLPAELAQLPPQALTPSQPPPTASTQTPPPAPQPGTQPMPPVAGAPGEPPPPPVVEMPPAPGPDYYWTDGYWDWGPTGWIWIGGRWGFGGGRGHYWGGWGHGRGGHWR